METIVTFVTTLIEASWLSLLDYLAEVRARSDVVMASGWAGWTSPSMLSSRRPNPS
ncbi:MAG: hypothetical protein JSW37_04125 [Anaerolineales bacterium]|nr:MAG: hypothetical protein JSW37_04125 [Anaerolineales bacterium]